MEVEQLDASIPFGHAEVRTVVAHYPTGIHGEMPFGKIIEFLVSGSPQIIDGFSCF